jgi:hypothetical protein
MSSPIFYASMDDLIADHDKRSTIYVGTLKRRLFEHERDSDTGLYVVVSTFDGDGTLRAARVLATAYSVIANGDERLLADRKAHGLGNIVIGYILSKHNCPVVRAFVGVDRNLLWPDASIGFAEFSGGVWVSVANFD